MNLSSQKKPFPILVAFCSFSEHGHGAKSEAACCFAPRSITCRACAPRLISYFWDRMRLDSLFKSSQRQSRWESKYVQRQTDFLPTLGLGPNPQALLLPVDRETLPKIDVLPHQIHNHSNIKLALIFILDKFIWIGIKFGNIAIELLVIKKYNFFVLEWLAFAIAR